MTKQREICTTFLHLSLRPSRLVGCHFAWLLDPALLSRLRPVTPLVTPPCLVGLSHCPGTRPFVRMIVVLPLVTPLPPVHLRFSFVKALGVICRRSRRLIRPVQHLLPQSGSGSGVSLNIAVFVVVVVCIRCQSGAYPAVAVAAGALVHARHQRPPTPTVAFAARARRQGVAPRRERVRMDDEKCPRNTVGVGPESQLCELVVTRLMQN